jgi:alginate O-acetyltransferase complex protein AlgI
MIGGGAFGILTPAWLLWVAATVAVHWLLPRRWRLAWLSLVGAAFLLHVDPLSLAALAALTALTWAACEAGGRSGAVVAALAVALLGPLVAFKSLVASGGGAAAVGVPLGMSYYTFRALHYALERYKRTLAPHTLGQFLAYMTFLPTLMAGPIHRFDAFHRDLHAPPADASLAARGLERMLVGYLEVVVLANFLVGARLAPYAASLGGPDDPAAAYLAMVAGTLNGYLQFAGYSDVAIGFALLLGFAVMENFDRPLLARNIVEFWQRWHISLTSWCRDYLYAVLATVTRRPYLAALVTMLAIGLWHELSPRYLLWGLWHGVGIALWHRWAELRARLPTVAAPWARRTLEALAVLATVHFVMLSFVLVQQPTLAAAARTYRAILLGWW